MNINKVIIAGNISTEIDVRATPNGVIVAMFNVAVNSKKANGEKQATFLQIKAWNKQADFLRRYASKGSGIYIEGSLKQAEWQDKQTGEKRSRLEIWANEIQLTGSRPQPRAEEWAEDARPPIPPEYDPEKGGIPF